MQNQKSPCKFGKPGTNTELEKNIINLIVENNIHKRSKLDRQIVS
jgi:hypothetical protein